MSSEKHLGVAKSRSSGGTGAAPVEAADPDRLPDIKPGAKLLTLREAIEIEKHKADARREVREAVGPKS
jgi:hypothetical protein